MATLPINAVLEGKYVNFREVNINDAEFILELRCDEKKSRYIHKTEYNVDKQKDYIRRYLTLDNEWYFIVENKKHEPIGTNSIYPYPIADEHWRDSENPKIGVLGPGRWLAKDGLSPLETLESDYLIKKMFFETFKKQFSPMMIHKDNKNVLAFHKSWGAQIFGFDDEMQQHLLDLKIEDYYKNKGKFERMLYGKILN